MIEERSGATTILLVCREGISREVYQAALALSGVLLVTVQSIMGFFRRGVYCPLNGILVDMPTYMFCSEEEKLFLTELVGIFPAMRLKCHEPSGEIRTLSFGTNYPGNVAPVVFVQKYCASFVKRSIRTCERSQINLSALLSRDLPEEYLNCERSVTAYLSCNGCFLVNFEPWIVGERGWLTFPGLADAVPILVEVRSIRLWGASRSLPGMGVCFVDLSAIQKAELSRLGGQSYMLE